MSTEGFYRAYYQERYGSAAAEKLTPVMTQIDQDELFRDIPSPVYYAYRPAYGRLNDEQSWAFHNLIEVIDACLELESDETLPRT